MSKAIQLSGTIAPKNEVLLGVELSGIRVREVLAEVGQQVKRGQTLINLDDRTLRMALRQAEAGRMQAQAGLTVASNDAKRVKELRERGLSSQRERDQAEAGLLNAKAALEVAEAQVAAARLNLDFASLQAPNDGIISARMVMPGQVVMPGSELFRLIEAGALEWRAELNEAQFLQVQIGDAVMVQSATGTSQGRVRAIDAGLRAETRTGVVYADLLDPNQFRAGVFARGEIDKGSAEVVSLPMRSIVMRGGFAYVFQVEGDVATQKQVQLGMRADDWVEVIGLDGSEKIVAEGGGFLADGDRVEVVP
jgi:RND family efflux transporter MFP subunit